MWGWLTCCRACPQGFPGGDAQTRCFYSLHISRWSEEMADGCVLFCCRGSSAQSMETQVVLTSWCWSLVGWHHVPGDLIELVPYNFSVQNLPIHKPILHLEDWYCLVSSAIPCRQHSHITSYLMYNPQHSHGEENLPERGLQSLAALQNLP